MLLPISIHTEDSDAQAIWDQLKTLSDGKIDGYNIDQTAIGGGLAWGAPGGGIYPPVPPPFPPKPPVITNPIGDENTTCWIQKKRSVGLPDQPQEEAPGLEMVVDASDANGKICVVAASDLDKQIGSFIPGDPATVADPPFSVLGNYGKAIFGTSAAFDWEIHRNGAASVADDGTSVNFTTKVAQKFGTAYKFTFAGTPAASDKTHTLPNVTGTIPVASSITANTLLKFSGTAGESVPSNVTDDGVYLKTGLAYLRSTRTDSLSISFDPNNSAPFMEIVGSDAVSGNSNGGEIDIRAGLKQGAGTNGVLDIRHADSTSRIKINADGTVTQAGDHSFTGSATVGDFRVTSKSTSLTNGQNYDVEATRGTVFVDVSGLTAAQNADVTLPSAVTYAHRVITTKITVVGAATSTLTIKSAAGTVEGVAAATGVALDASSRSFVTYQSDGTNWWRTN